MEGNMKIEVPITIKGGREGDKVGKQIGEKIAASLNKSLKSVGFGKTSSSVAPSSGGSSTRLLGMSKGIGSIVTKLGIIGVIAGTTLGLMKKSSGQLRGILSVFGRAFIMFFRPFGDFLANMLRPLAITLMKAAVAWLKFSRTTAGSAVVGTAVGGISGGVDAIAGEGTFKDAFGFGGSLSGAGIFDKIFGTDIIGKSKEFPGWLWEKLKSIWNWSWDFGSWLVGKLKTVWNYVGDFNSWLVGKLKTIWNYTMDFGSWLWEQVKTIWNYTMDFGSWLLGKLKTIWDYTFDFGSWLVGKIKSIWNWSWDVGSWLKSKIKNIFSSSSSDDTTGYATGTSFVPETGMYQLHRGESVIPRVQNTNNKAQNIVMNPTINVMSNSSNIDGAAIAKQFNNEVMSELKSRGIL